MGLGRGASEEGWRSPTSASDVFDAFARGIEPTSPATAQLLRQCGQDGLALSLVPAAPSWDVPHRMLAAVRWLVFAGEVEDFTVAPNPWLAFREVLVDRGDWVACFIREQTVQTNEVQRCWVLLPLFLTVAQRAQRPLDLIELGTSGALNLYWDRYHYRYEGGTWGDPKAPLQLAGEERSLVPTGLLDVEVQVRRRCGIDLNPIDVTTEAGVRLLRSFDPREEHRARLEAAAETVRTDPPELLRGDYLDVLPPLLAERDTAALTVVFQTLSTVYLTDEQRARLSSIIEVAAREGPLAWISTPTPEEHGQRRGDYPLEIAVWPGIAPRIAARMNVRADWMEWVG